MKDEWERQLLKFSVDPRFDFLAERVKELKVTFTKNKTIIRRQAVCICKHLICANDAKLTRELRHH